MGGWVFCEDGGPETGYAIEKRSVVFTHPDTGERKEVPLEKGMSKKELISKMTELGYPMGKDCPFEFFCEDEDMSWIKELLDKDFDRIQWQDRRQLMPQEKINIETTATITEKHHRGIAKIAFNYMMYFRPSGITGFEESFKPLREFIRYGKGHPKNFVRMAKKDIIYGVGNYIALSDYGHIVTCSVDNFVSSFVHIFTGREPGHKPYQVLLGRYPHKIATFKENIGNWFKITKTDRASKDIGEILPLFSPTRVICNPSRF